MAKDFDISVTMTGIDELSKMLQGLSYETQKKGGRFALRKAAQVLRDAARSNARRVDDPETPTSIPDSIVERWSGRYNKATGDLKFRVGVLGGAKGVQTKTTTNKKGKTKTTTTGSEVFYWRFLEFGTSKMAARPFFRPAVESNVQNATNVFIREYQKAIARRIAKGEK